MKDISYMNHRPQRLAAHTRPKPSITSLHGHNGAPEHLPAKLPYHSLTESRRGQALDAGVGCS
eukprot:scaffold333666_cov38-Prasinocladus_malaysianus.AAC.1